MEKKFLLLIFYTILMVFAFSQDTTFQFQLDGNAHILPYNTLKKVYQMKNNGEFMRFSAEDLYDFYNELYQLYGDNQLMLDQKRKETENSLIVIYGYVNRVRKSLLDEYIVELEVKRPNIIMNLSVVFPKRISPAMINELMTIKKGNYFESLAMTRTTCFYVDVPVWNSNGVYRTEP